MTDTLQAPTGLDPVLANIATRINVADMLTRATRRTPNTTAIVDGERRISYRDFDAWVNRIARGLLDRGYVRGDSLALMMPNRAEFLVVYYACARTGVIAVPINLGWTVPEISYVLNHSQARGIVVAPAHLDVLLPERESFAGLADLWVLDESAPVHGVECFSALAADSDAEVRCVVEDRDPLQYLYTSGTTSAPKGVVTSHLAVYVESLSGAIDKQLRPGEVMACVMPLFHTAQLNTWCTGLVATGATMVLQAGFDADRWLDSVESEHVSVAFLLPMMIRELLGRDDIGTREFSSLRLMVYAMAPMPQHELERAMDVFGCNFGLSFGQTEMSPESTFSRPEHQLTHIGAVGTPGTSVTLAILDGDGAEVPTGEVGQIAYRSPQLLTGYLRDEEATRESFIDGWFLSGDLGRLSEDGVLYFVDRAKDLIKSGGENVSSLEVEKACFAADPNVAVVAVIGLPHDRWIEAVTAVVVPKVGREVDASGLLSQLKHSLAGYKVPKAVIVATDIPHTSTGKIQKVKLRERYHDYYQAADRLTDQPEPGAAART